MAKPPKTGKPCNLSLSVLKLDPRLQARVDGVQEEHAADIAEAIKDRKSVPRPRVIMIQPEDRNPDGTLSDPEFYVVDGFHTVRAYALAGRKTVPCRVQVGTMQDAMLAAAAANQEHLGLPRSNRDKQRAAELALRAGPGRSDRRIAEYIGVSDKTVAEARARLEAGAEIPHLVARQGSDGKKYARKRRAPKKPDMDLAGVDAGYWQALPLDEFLQADDHVWEALREAGLTTAGQLDAAIEEGREIGLNQPDLKALAGQVAVFKTAGEPKAEKPGSAAGSEEEKPGSNEPLEIPFDWRMFHACFGGLVRQVNTLAKAVGHVDDHGLVRNEGPYAELKEHLDQVLVKARAWYHQVMGQAAPR